MSESELFVNILHSLLYTQRCVPEYSLPFHVTASIFEIGHSSHSGEPSAMTMRVNSYVHSSDTLDPDPYSFNVSSRVNSDVQRSSGHGHLPLVPKVEEDDLHHIKILERRLDTCTARSTNQPKELTKREQRKKNEAENDKFTGLRLEELQSERYLRYREKSRQKAKEKNGQGNVWPDFLEHAFQCGKSRRNSANICWCTDESQALRDVQPMGRKKRMCEGKLCGRNELISKRIKELTGVDRDRKKVSSHIQVLRGFMNDNHACRCWRDAYKAIGD